MQGRDYGALGFARIRTTRRATPERLAAEKRAKGPGGGCCPPWGHTYYPHDNALTFEGDEQGIDKLLKDMWPDAWLNIQPVLTQIDELTADAWSTRYARCHQKEGPCDGVLNNCCPNKAVDYHGDSYVHQRLVATTWIVKLNEVLNAHGLVADLYQKSTYHITESSSDDGPTSYSAKTGIALLLRVFLWSARVAQAPPQQMQVAVPPGVAGGHTVAVTAPDGLQYSATVPAMMMPGQIFVFQLPARAPTAPPTPAMQVAVPPGVAPGQAIAAMGPDGKQYTTTVPVGAGPGQLFQLNLQADAAWWRSVEPPLAVPMAVPVQPQAGPQGMQMVRVE